MYKKEMPYYYFLHLYKKEVKNIKDFLSTKERALVRKDIVKKYELVSILHNKLSFALYCEIYNLKTPEPILYSLSNNYYYNKKVTTNINNRDLVIYIRDILKNESVDELFVRPLSLFGGTGCFKLTLDNLEATLEEQRESLQNGNYLFTKVVKQHPEINKIQEKSVNTIRMLTHVTDEGKISMLSAVMRFGVGDSVVDNSSAGGFYIPINLKEGTLMSKGWAKTDFGGERITHHPDSKFKLEGFKIPFYKESCEMVIEYTKYIPNKLIGWDVAITPDGPTIIEANDSPYLGLSDIGAGGLL
ncbi:sugar-transfer associated ATP-grasp domain-containing protein, partial [Flagellimonas nanhaiensis]